MWTVSRAMSRRWAGIGTRLSLRRAARRRLRAKYRLPDGRVHRTIAPAWTGRGRPRAGYFTKRTVEDWSPRCPGPGATGRAAWDGTDGRVNPASAAGAYLLWLEVDRQRSRRRYHSVIRVHLLPASGGVAIEDLTSDAIERGLATDAASNRTEAKVLTILGGILDRARRLHRLPHNPVRDVEKAAACCSA